jgi:glutamate synthase (NADPH/NADH) small chain
MAGGLDTFGMAEYKMTKADSLAEVAQVESLGVTFRLNTTVTSAFAADDIQGLGDLVVFHELLEQHDAIFVGVGLGKTRELEIVGEGLRGVFDALRFIELVKTRDWKLVPVGKSVVVIGAGNTAIDAVTQAKRLGAEKATLVYRRTEKDAPAYDYELELAKSDGIEFIWQAEPVRVMSDASGNVAGLLCKRSDGIEFELACDVVIKAIGQTKTRSFFTDVCEIDVDEAGRVVVNDQMQTSNPKVFAGGDCVNGGGEAVEAAQMGKLAAIGIHERLTGGTVSFAGAKVAQVTPSDHRH